MSSLRIPLSDRSPEQTLHSTMATAVDPLAKLEALREYAVDRCAELGESYECPDNGNVPLSDRGRELGAASLSRVKARRLSAKG